MIFNYLKIRTFAHVNQNTSLLDKVFGMVGGSLAVFKFNLCGLFNAKSCPCIYL